MGPVAALLVLASLVWGLRAVPGRGGHVAVFLLGAITISSEAILNSMLSVASDCANPPAVVGIGSYALCTWQPPWATTQAGPPTFISFGVVAIAAAGLLAVLGFRSWRRSCRSAQLQSS